MRSSIRQFLLPTCLGVLITLLSACGGGGDAGVASNSGMGKVSLGVTDAPVDSATAVVVQFSGVAFKRQGDAAETVTQLSPATQSVDLMKYQGGQAAALVQNVTLPAGTYEWVRLLVNADPNVVDSYLLDTQGRNCELRIPSGAETGLKLNRGFTIPADGSVALTVDFDLRQSIHAPPGMTGNDSCTQGYLLRPTLRVVDNTDVGAIAGTVSAALVPTGCVPVVYIFAGNNVIPDDYETVSSSSSSSASSGSSSSSSSAAVDVDAVATVAVRTGTGMTAFNYQAAFMPVGNYTVSFTCVPDDPDADEVLTFVQTQNVTVQRNLISTANFVAL